jgi:hypothetical protein
MICKKCKHFKEKSTIVGFCSELTKLVTNIKECKSFEEMLEIKKIIIKNGKKEYIYG